MGEIIRATATDFGVSDTGETRYVSGYTPIRGIDYWTSEDIAEIKAYIDMRLEDLL